MKRRVYKVLTVCAALLAGGCAYAAICGWLGFGLPCLFNKVTGLLCPGCGVSRMCMSLLRLDFAAAWRYNPAVLCLLPLGAAVAADTAARYIKTGSTRLSKWANTAVWVMIAALLLFGLWRNL